ncbi:MAG: hypothetical protein U5K31_06780 [Balneolaceae bacterium]|nr:hypothetical protein [Balneolaceae bacterium]
MNTRTRFLRRTSGALLLALLWAGDLLGQEPAVPVQPLTPAGEWVLDQEVI